LIVYSLTSHRSHQLQAHVWYNEVIEHDCEDYFNCSFVFKYSSTNTIRTRAFELYSIIMAGLAALFRMTTKDLWDWEEYDVKYFRLFWLSCSFGIYHFESKKGIIFFQLQLLKGSSPFSYLSHPTKG